MKSTARRFSSSTVQMTSFTLKATCWMPGPWLSSTNLKICESRKCGRSGSLVANFTWLTGSHITIDFSPEPWANCAATSFVWNLISQNGSNPSTSLYQPTMGTMVSPLDVTWSTIWMP